MPSVGVQIRVRATVVNEGATSWVRLMTAEPITPEESFLFQSHALIECVKYLGERECEPACREWLETHVFLGRTTNIIKFNSPRASIFQGQGVLLACLYLFLVIPHEWRRRNTLHIDLSNAEQVAAKQIEVVNDTYPSGHTSPLSHLRNALAHGRINWENGTNKFLFNDENPRNSAQKFVGPLSMEGLGQLAEALNASIRNYIEQIANR